MQNPLFFSIIIPTLNEEFFLPNLLADLKSQKEQCFEVIIVDGDSYDKTKKKALQFDSDLKLRFYNVKKRNLAYQRNYGAKKSHGEFLIFLDADVRIDSLFLKKIAAQIKKYKNLIYFPALYPQAGTRSDNLLYKLINFIIESSQKTKKPIAAWTVFIIKKDFFHLLGGYKESTLQEKGMLYFEDQELLMRAVKKHIQAKFIRSAQVGVSLRRTQREGTLHIFTKYFFSAFDLITRGKFENPIKYEMGGHLYSSPKS